AVQRLLDRDADRGGHEVGTRAGIARAHLDRGRDDVGILRDRQRQQADEPQENDDDCDDVREDRALDEEPGHAQPAGALVAGVFGGPASAACGVTSRPGIACRIPSTITRSSAVRPSFTTSASPTCWPVFTARRWTTFLSSTTRTYSPCWSKLMASPGTSRASRFLRAGTRTRTKRPGSTRESWFGYVPRTCRVPVVGATLVAAKSRRPSCGWPSSSSRPKKNGIVPCSTVPSGACRRCAMRSRSRSSMVKYTKSGST